ncbi:lipocalin-like domain-containing protein [Rhodococcus sp. NPDC003318]|uniref:lipocalin-like domain-containing protein n=1 Tax=Rhodococcus sp. NPDC003318 TaxID=3364503 RepID=UPI0036BD84F1
MSGASIVGRWSLQSWVTRSESGALDNPFGEHAEGSLVYTAGGWVSLHLAADDRPRQPASLLGASGTTSERAAAYSSYVAYCGTYHVEGDIVVHRVTNSLYPNWLGSELRRIFSLNSDSLVLAMPTPEGQEPLVNELHWTRME